MKKTARPLEWSRQAKSDLQDLWLFISQDNQKYADDVAKRIHDTTDKLKQFPMIGKLSGYYKTRTMPVRNTQITVFYRVMASKVLIVRLMHQRRNYNH